MFFLVEDPTPVPEEKAEAEAALFTSGFNYRQHPEAPGRRLPQYGGKPEEMPEFYAYFVKEAFLAGYHAACQKREATDTSEPAPATPLASEGDKPRRYLRVERKIRHPRWRRLHNLLAHPMLEIYRPLGQRLHDYTAERMYDGSETVILGPFDEVNG